MSSETLVVVIDSRIWLPPRNELPRPFYADLRDAFTHSNPEFYKKQSMGYATWNVPRTIRTCAEVDDALIGKRFALPRGGMGVLRHVVKDYGFKLRFVDRRVTSPVEFPTFRVMVAGEEKSLWPYQAEAVARALTKQQGVIRAPTGSGKTVAALAFIAEAEQRSMVIVRDGNLAKQWIDVASNCLGIPKREIGLIRGGRKWKPGHRLSVALQQSLYSKGDLLDHLIEETPFGTVIVDEVQTLAARTFIEVVSRLAPKFLVGFSADETRKDKKEFLIYDMLGDVIHEIDDDEVKAAGQTVPVDVFVVETEFRADWYRDAEGPERSFTDLVASMVIDEDRNALIVDLFAELARDFEVPSLAFTHRREHARELADHWLRERRIRCGLLLGGVGQDAIRFEEDLERLSSGNVEFGIGTFQSIGVGHDIPVVRAGICLTPISGNRQFFGQVKGRICRSASGKERGKLFYVWDREVFPNQLRYLEAWTDGDVFVRRGGQWVKH